MNKYNTGVKSSVTAARLLREFSRGLSTVGLARKYAMTRVEVEARTRAASARRVRRRTEPW